MTNITGSVGKRGVNKRQDVVLVQKLLNGNLGPRMKVLAEDGIAGPKTNAAIENFQRRVLRVSRPDGRVDPGQRTIKALSTPGSGSGTSAVPLFPPSSAVGVSVQQKQHMQQVFVDQNKQTWWPEFWKFIVEEATPEVKRFFSMIGRLDEAAQVARFYVVLRRDLGVKPREIKQILQAISGIKDPRWSKDFVKFLANEHSWSRVGRTLKYFNDAGKIVGFFAFLVEYINHWSKGDYHMAIVEVYKTYMGEQIPWAGYIDTIQTFAGAILPVSWQTETGYKTLKAIDPIGLGAQGVDFAGVLVTMAIEGKMDERRVYRLADRMKKGSTAFFYDMGEDLANALAAISEMKDEEFNEMMTAGNIWGWLNDFWLTKYTPSLVLYRWVQGLLS